MARRPVQRERHADQAAGPWRPVLACCCGCSTATYPPLAFSGGRVSAAVQVGLVATIGVALHVAATRPVADADRRRHDSRFGRCGARALADRDLGSNRRGGPGRR